MKIIDFETKGNVVKFYLGDDDARDYWGDDWDDVPYEHNAGWVYDEFRRGELTIAFPLNYVVTEAANDWTYHGNSPFSKRAMKNRECPCIIVAKLREDEYDGDYPYHKYMKSMAPNVLRIYFEDNAEEVIEKVKRLGGTIM